MLCVRCGTELICHADSWRCPECGYIKTRDDMPPDKDREQITYHHERIAITFEPDNSIRFVDRKNYGREISFSDLAELINVLEDMLGEAQQ
jgi:hypothetical protein